MKEKKLEKLFNKLEYIFCESVDIMGDDDNDVSRSISFAENAVLDEIRYIKKPPQNGGTEGEERNRA